MKKYIFISITLALTSIFFISYKKNSKTIYDEFTFYLKSGRYFEGYKLLYPLALKKERIVSELISESYLGGYGISMDIIKSQIWHERSKVCYHCETGSNEFEQYQIFLDKKDYGMASVFLQKSAEKGNKNAILLLKNNDFLEKNYLNIDPNWKKYWQDFDYDNLYPFCQDIEECRKDVESKKSTDTK